MLHHEPHEGHEVRKDLVISSFTFVIFVPFVVSKLIGMEL